MDLEITLFYHNENKLLEGLAQMGAMFSVGGICTRMKGNKVVKAETTDRK